jgi:hypothetical protein
MTLTDPAALVTVISALAAAIVSVVNAIAGARGRQEAKDTAVTLAAKVDSTATTLAANTSDKAAALAVQTQGLVTKADDAAVKLDQIHELTNSNMSALKQQLSAALARIDALEGRLIADGKLVK